MHSLIEDNKYELFGIEASNGPAVSYMGGKFRYSKEIINYFPEHMTTYVEPYVGGGGVFFQINKIIYERIVINDLNENLINLYKCLQYDFWRTYLAIYFTSNNINLDLNSTDNFIRAASYYIALFSSFNGQVHSGIHISRSKHLPLSIINRLMFIRGHIEKAEIWSKDGIDCIKENDSNSTIFYIDPPYMIKGASKYYETSMEVQQHKNLLDTLKEIKGKFVLSYEDTQEMRMVLDGYDFKIFQLRITNSSSNTGKKQNELLITNYEPNNIQTSLEV